MYFVIYYVDFYIFFLFTLTNGAKGDIIVSNETFCTHNENALIK